MKAPFPYFGGKARAAHLVWERFGRIANYVEPFFGSGAVLLARPEPPGGWGTETVNDADGLLANFWRAIKADPEAVAGHADWPVNENDLHARHAWMVGQKDSLQARLEGDPDFYDAKVAGWWVWGLCIWIGVGWCSGEGPWRVQDGKMVKAEDGRGVNRKLPHLGDDGRGVHRQRPHLGDDGCGPHLEEWFGTIAARLRRVRVACGDWTRVCGQSVTTVHGLTGVFLDPPYADTAGRDPNLYRVDCDQVAHAVREWAIEAGKHPLMRVALCGYEGEHVMPPDWQCVPWKALGGYANGENLNARRERIWFSPGCDHGHQGELLF